MRTKYFRVNYNKSVNVISNFILYRVASTAHGMFLLLLFKIGYVSVVESNRPHHDAVCPSDTDSFDGTRSIRVATIVLPTSLGAPYSMAAKSNPLILCKPDVVSPNHIEARRCASILALATSLTAHPNP